MPSVVGHRLRFLFRPVGRWVPARDDGSIMMYGSSITFRADGTGMIATWGTDPASPSDEEAFEWRSDGLWTLRVRRGGQTWNRLRYDFLRIPGPYGDHVCIYEPGRASVVGHDPPFWVVPEPLRRE